MIALLKRYCEMSLSIRIWKIGELKEVRSSHGEKPVSNYNT